ncbi:serine threonine protein [Apiospora aurea]|uniref:Serine threonine protein n=1 Tax=Apiospora aurea TaxID=335848 RepID=A0ABR1QMU1_9PEZI
MHTIEITVAEETVTAGRQIPPGATEPIRECARRALWVGGQATIGKPSHFHLALLLSGLPPNVGVNVSLTRFGGFLREHIPRLEGDQCSPEQKSLVAFCLEESPAQRPTVQQVQDHPCIRDTGSRSRTFVISYEHRKLTFHEHREVLLEFSADECVRFCRVRPCGRREVGGSGFVCVAGVSIRHQTTSGFHHPKTSQYAPVPSILGHIGEVCKNVNVLGGILSIIEPYTSLDDSQLQAIYRIRATKSSQADGGGLSGEGSPLWRECPLLPGARIQGTARGRHREGPFSPYSEQYGGMVTRQAKTNHLFAKRVPGLAGPGSDDPVILSSCFRDLE